MRRILFISIVVISFDGLLFAQNLSEERSILQLTGAGELEELSQEEYESFSVYLSRPLRINMLSQSRLAATPMLSGYQAASIVDYRSRHGDILSAEELMLLDGFSREIVQALLPFISFDSSRAPGERANFKDKLSWSALGKTIIAPYDAFKLKVRAGYGDYISLGATFDNNFYLMLSPPRRKWSVLIGDYRLRFGQGLLYWNGFTIGGYSTLQAFFRRPNGAAPALSFSADGIRRGAVLTWHSRKLQATGFYDIRSGSGGSNVTLFRRSGQAGVSARIGGRGFAISLDGMYNIKGIVLTGETAYDGGKLTAVAGLRLPQTGRWTGAAVYKRLIKSSEAAAIVCYSAEKRVKLKGLEGFGSSVKALEISSSLAFKEKEGGKRELKWTSDLRWQISKLVCLKSKYVRTLRNYDVAVRNDIRTDFLLSDGMWSLAARVNAAIAAGTGVMGYLEGGYKSDKLQFHLRAAAFSVDDWADRIYMWERDVQDGFSVPVCYGRGYRLSAVAGGHFRYRRLRARIYVKGAVTDYPFMSEKKPGKAELRFTFCLEG